LGIHLEVVITDGSQPIGRGIGPALEARDVMQVLQNDREAPDDLRQKALYLAGRVLEFDPDVRGGQGYNLARDILESGRALRKMQQIIEAQGAAEPIPAEAPLNEEVLADADGWVTAIDNYQMARIARLAGAPMDLNAGVDLYKKLGDRVEKGEPLYRIQAEFPADFRFARNLARRDMGFRIGPESEITRSYLEI
ncbi:MAG TPA: thymidine phosphorylase, partial [Thiotrichales bacterium]|nr:thymidine phosphorylase [Thiotrichales bacterium]